MTLHSSGLLHAVLGPTNTGKTHYALSRMIGHESGIIGFPLRLLARENYERLTHLKGKDFVGLVTGEEKIIPPKAKWFSCTVESMPLERKVKFIAIDEIQLSGDPDRGHIFTDRLLHARGEEETLFLGAEIIRPLLRKLLPGIVIETRPRLSNLTYTDPLPLNRLPPRTAIVAFSASEIYALAEIIRQKRGGCALIMGRLSPRTRNAQIKLYQKGEVDYIVATDAIGMGLNMDVNHVVLSSLRKFDGRQHRPLTMQEIAQIAGRAGRGMKDGTFSTIKGAEALSQDVINAIETHNFPVLKQIYWRENFLDFTNPQTLLSSLQNKPPYPELTRGREASDLAVLEYLARSEPVISSARTHKTTRLLWDVCQIPDFKKLGDGSHAQLCEKLYLHLLREKKIPTSWIEGQLASLNQHDGDIETLMQRLQGVRVCSYIASHQQWLTQSHYWQERSHEVENKLSDILHERLTARFVNKRAATLLKRNFADFKGNLFYKITKDKHILVEGHDIGRIRGFTIELENYASKEEKELLLKTAKRALHSEMPALIRQFLTETSSALSLQDNGIINWDGAAIGQIMRGKSYFEPDISLLSGDFQDSHQRNIVLQHLHSLIFMLINNFLTPLEKARNESRHDPFLRGLIHRIYEDGGLTVRHETDRFFTHAQRRLLTRNHIVINDRYIYCAPFFVTPLKQILLLLHFLWHNGQEHNTANSPGIIKLGPALISVSQLGKIMTLLKQAQKRTKQIPAPCNLASMLGIKQKLVPEVLKLLDIPHQSPRPLPENIYGPAAPLMLKGHSAQKKGKKKRIRALNHPDYQQNSPFNALKNFYFKNK